MRMLDSFAMVAFRTFPRRAGALRLLRFAAAAFAATLALTTPASAEEIVLGPPGLNPDAPTLADAVAMATPNTTIRLSPGIYELTPVPYTEPTCGNCQDPNVAVETTVGLGVSGVGIRILGARDGETVIRTNAGYGILFQDCRDCAISGVTVTGGVRSPSPAATDAGIVVKRSTVTIEDCQIRDNIGDAELVNANVVGISGIVGREGAEMTIRGNRILRNSWDGIVLYREAEALIESNVIDGVDMAQGEEVGGGRGVGIGVTWDGYANIRGNLVRNYWKGIGAFVDAQVLVEENVVEHIATWGLTLWDADTGKPAGFFLRNVVYDTGACGASIIRTSEEPPFPGRFVHNILVATGQDERYDNGEPYCFQLPVAEHSVPSVFSVAGNVLQDNRVGPASPPLAEPSPEVYRHRVQQIWEATQAWPPLAESDFWREFGPSAP